jgi:hypothetical protein
MPRVQARRLPGLCGQGVASVSPDVDSRRSGALHRRGRASQVEATYLGVLGNP